MTARCRPALRLALLAALHMAAQPPAFDIVSLKPSKPGARGGAIRALPGGQTYVSTNAPVALMIMLMYKVLAGS